jgi:hypothetical protein
LLSAHPPFCFQAHLVLAWLFLQIHTRLLLEGICFQFLEMFKMMVFQKWGQKVLVVQGWNAHFHNWKKI